MKRWTCPTCNRGVNAPERMSSSDVRGWCLKCSARTGKLVRRVVPSRETEAKRRAEARADRTAKHQERAVARRQATADRTRQLAAATDREPMDGAAWLRAWAPRILKLRTWRSWSDALAGDSRWTGKPEIIIRQGRERVAMSYAASGHAWPNRQRLTITTGRSAADSLVTLVHEIAHLVAPPHDHHSPRFHAIQADAIAELTGTAPTSTATISEHVVTVAAWLSTNRSNDQ